MGKTGVGDVPAAGALGLLAHFQGDLPPSVWEERAKGLAGVDTAAVEKQAGGGSVSSGEGSLICPSLSLFMIEPPRIINTKKKAVFLQLTENTDPVNRREESYRKTGLLSESYQLCSSKSKGRRRQNNHIPDIGCRTGSERVQGSGD